MTETGSALITVNGAALDGHPLPELDQLADEIRWHVEQSEGAVRDALRHRLEVGLRLRRAKDFLGHGEFMSWAKREFGWSHDTCQNHMQLAAPANYERVRNLPSDVSWREIKKALKDGGDEGEEGMAAAVSEIDQDDAPVPGEQGYRDFTRRLKELAHLATEAARVLETKTVSQDFREQQVRNLDRRLTDVLIGAEAIKQVIDQTAKRVAKRPAKRRRSGNEWDAEEAYAALVQLAETQPEVHVDELAAAYPLRSPAPNANGYVWQRAKRERVLKETGEMRPTKQPGKNGHRYPVYRSLVYREGAA